MAQATTLAFGAAEFPAVLILLCVVVVPIAAIAFARSGRGYAEIGRGRFAVDFDESDEDPREDEVRQLVEAKAYRQARRGEQPVDIEAEIERLLDPAARETDEPEDTDGQPPEPAPEPAGIRAEIRQVVVARNEARERRGEPPLDVEAEVERMLEEFG